MRSYIYFRRDKRSAYLDLWDEDKNWEKIERVVREYLRTFNRLYIEV